MVCPVFSPGRKEVVFSQIQFIGVSAKPAVVRLKMAYASLVEFVQSTSPRARLDCLTLKSRGRVNGGRHIGGCGIKPGGVVTIERHCRLIGSTPPAFRY